MKEERYSSAVKAWAPQLWAYLKLASDAERRKALLAVIDFALASTTLEEPILLRIVEKLKLGVLPDAQLSSEGAEVVNKLDEEYQNIFVEFGGDRSPNAPWVKPYQRYIAGDIIRSGCNPDAWNAVIEAIFHAFTIERVGGPPGMADRVLSVLVEHAKLEK